MLSSLLESEGGELTDLIHDRGRGPELVGTRITVYNLLPHFLDAEMTEDAICRFYDLTAEQVAAARAYVLNNAECVLAEHLKIEARMAAGNPPEVVAKAKETHATFLRFKNWLAQRAEFAARQHNKGATSASGHNGPSQFPTFRQWLADQKSRPEERS
jgi:uncharacterized protein (DUF433 family)